MWLIAGFVALGFLIGNLVGLSATSAVTALLGLVFAFAGGSILAFLEKFGVEDRRVAAQALFALSIACTVGLYTGIVVSEHQLLSPRRPVIAVADSLQRGKARESVADRKYLRSGVLNGVDAIEALHRRGDLSGEAAYKQLRDLILATMRDSTP